jgi:hypothetical protein
LGPADASLRGASLSEILSAGHALLRGVSMSSSLLLAGASKISFARWETEWHVIVTC